MDLTKAGLEKEYILDNECYKFMDKEKRFIKIDKIVYYSKDQSIIGLYSYYDIEKLEKNDFLRKELHNSIYDSKFNKVFEEYMKNKQNVIKKGEIKFSDDEFIDSIEVLTDDNQNEDTIYGLNVITNKNNYEIGRFKNQKLEKTKIITLQMKNQFIIGLKTSYAVKASSAPKLSSIKIYTTNNSNRHKYHKPTTNILSKTLKFLKVILQILFFLLLSLTLVLIYYYHSQNIHKGLLILNNEYLEYPTKLHTDEHGFAHIKAENLEDAYFTLGVAHARDRLWQMDFLRRLARGQLSEVLGEGGVKIDKMFRNIGLNHYAEMDTEYVKSDYEEDEPAMKIYKKYEAGINYYANTHFLPPEYYLLNINFRNWTMTDSLAYYRLLTYMLTLDWPVELFNHYFELTYGSKFFNLLYDSTYRNFPYANDTIMTEAEIEKLNLSTLNKTYFGFPKRNVTTFDPEIHSTGKIKETSNTNNINLDLLNPHASNSWAIHGNHTKSGKPIISNDPHSTLR